MRSNLIAGVVLLASSGLALPGLAERAACTTNACLAALASKTATAKSDCSTYLATTVTPCPERAKATVTITSTYGCPPPMITYSAIISSSIVCPVTQTASTVPSYAASACSAGAFSSACGCLNVPASHTTLAPSTITATTYKTVSVKPTFTLKAISGSRQGQYLAGGPPGNQGQNGYHDGGMVYFVGTDKSEAEYYTINGNGTVFGGGGMLEWTSPAQNCYGCYFEVTEYAPDAGYDANRLKCRVGTVLRGDGYLTFECQPAGWREVPGLYS